MKLFAKISPLFCLLALLLPVLPVAAGNLPIQIEPAGSTWDTVVADAKAQSTGAMSGGTPIYHSTKLEETTLEGDFTADANTTNLAIFSDDGCDVTINGNKMVSARDKGQALPDLSQSLSKLSTTLTPGQTYHIKIDYSNVIYTGNADIDGCTLFAWGNDSLPVVTLTADDPGDPDQFQQVTSKVYAKVDHLPSGHFASDLTAIWTWYMEDTIHSDTVDGAFTADGVDRSLFTITGDNADLTSPTATFKGEFDLDGFYEVSVRATVIYHDNRTGQNLGPYTSADTGDVYLGDHDDEPSAVATATRLLPASGSVPKRKKIVTSGPTHVAFLGPVPGKYTEIKALADPSHPGTSYWGHDDFDNLELQDANNRPYSKGFVNEHWNQDTSDGTNTDLSFNPDYKVLLQNQGVVLATQTGTKPPDFVDEQRTVLGVDTNSQKPVGDKYWCTIIQHTAWGINRPDNIYYNQQGHQGGYWKYGKQVRSHKIIINQSLIKRYPL